VASADFTLLADHSGALKKLLLPRPIYVELIGLRNAAYTGVLRSAAAEPLKSGKSGKYFLDALASLLVTTPFGRRRVANITLSETLDLLLKEPSQLDLNPRNSFSRHSEVLGSGLNPTPAPECLQSPSDTFILVEADETEAGPTAGTAALPVGVNHFQCCIHPWMRITINVQQASP